MAVYVQYGAGFSGPEGWLNFDSSPTLRLERVPLLGKLVRKNAKRFPDTVIYGDIVTGIPVKDNSADAVFASHVLEHLSREDFGVAIDRTYRMLKSGGTFRLVVPDLEWRCREYIRILEDGDTTANDKFMIESHLGQKKRSLVQSLGGSLHLWMWDEPSMKVALAGAGFANIRRCKFGDSSDPMFAMVEDETRFVVRGVFDELAMEAIKP